MSVEKMVDGNLARFVLLKTARDAVCVASQCLGAASRGIWSIGDTLLAVECHYGRRYSDLTGRDLGIAMAQPSRHEMILLEPPEAPDES